MVANEVSQPETPRVTPAAPKNIPLLEPLSFTASVAVKAFEIRPLVPLPALSLQQKSASRNPRSTVGTVTEIHDYFRLLFAHIGKPHCWVCNRLIQKQTVQQIVDSVMKIDKESKIIVLAPLVKGRKGEHKKILENIKKDGIENMMIYADFDYTISKMYVP